MPGSSGSSNHARLRNLNLLGSWPFALMTSPPLLRICGELIRGAGRAQSRSRVPGLGICAARPRPRRRRTETGLRRATERGKTEEGNGDEEAAMRTEVAIIGGGPSGLLLSRLLQRAGIESVVLERRPRAHVLSRIRAGVLEWGTVETLRRAGVGARMDAEGEVHHGTVISSGGRGVRIDFDDLVDGRVMVYGQTEVTRDLYAAHDAAGGAVIDEAEVTGAEGLERDGPVTLSYRCGGERREVTADWVAGCDGFRGVSRGLIPAGALREFERVWPFGWLGVLTEAPPASPEVLYAHHERGFALCSMRNPRLSRYYLQVPADEDPAAWSAAAFFDELRQRVPEAVADRLEVGPVVETSVAPLRSYVAEP